jgi:hypothetical protein
MLVIEIESTDLNVKSGTSARTGKPYQIREQTAYVHIPPNKYPQPVKITLDDDAQAYAPGKYQLADSSFFVGRFDDLQMRPRLVPVVAAAAAPARQAS